VIACNIPQDKVLGRYQAKGPGGPISDATFREDGRVDIQRKDGNHEVWQP
jgi:hypothetical protein